MGPLKYAQAHSVTSCSLILSQLNDREKLGGARAAVEARPLAQRHLMSVDGTVNALPSSREHTKCSFLSLLWIKPVRPEATGRPVIFLASPRPEKVVGHSSHS